MESSAQNLSRNRPDAAGKHFEVCETKKMKNKLEMLSRMLNIV